MVWQDMGRQSECGQAGEIRDVGDDFGNQLGSGNWKIHLPWAGSNNKGNIHATKNQLQVTLWL